MGVKNWNKKANGLRILVRNFFLKTDRNWFMERATPVINGKLSEESMFRRVAGV